MPNSQHRQPLSHFYPSTLTTFPNHGTNIAPAEWLDVPIGPKAFYIREHGAWKRVLSPAGIENKLAETERHVAFEHGKADKEPTGVGGSVHISKNITPISPLNPGDEKLVDERTDCERDVVEADFANEHLNGMNLDTHAGSVRVDVQTIVNGRHCPPPSPLRYREETPAGLNDEGRDKKVHGNDCLEVRPHKKQFTNAEILVEKKGDGALVMEDAPHTIHEHSCEFHAERASTAEPCSVPLTLSSDKLSVCTDSGDEDHGVKTSQALEQHLQPRDGRRATCVNSVLPARYSQASRGSGPSNEFADADSISWGISDSLMGHMAGTDPTTMSTLRMTVSRAEFQNSPYSVPDTTAVERVRSADDADSAQHTVSGGDAHSGIPVIHPGWRFDVHRKVTAVHGAIERKTENWTSEAVMKALLLCLFVCTGALIAYWISLC